MTGPTDKEVMPGGEGIPFRAYNPKWYRLDRVLWWVFWARWTYDVRTVIGGYAKEKPQTFYAYRKLPTAAVLMLELEALQFKFKEVVSMMSGGRETRTTGSVMNYSDELNATEMHIRSVQRGETEEDVAVFLRQKEQESLAEDVEAGFHRGVSTRVRTHRPATKWEEHWFSETRMEASLKWHQDIAAEDEEAKADTDE